MKFVVLDLEATCWEKKKKGQVNEIIEIGALLLDENGGLISEFEQFIKPQVNPTLSEFCTELTTIRQEDVDAAQAFPEVLNAFHEWFGMAEGNYVLGSWGFYDKIQFTKDCNLHGLPTEWLERHVSIKHQHKEICGLTKPLGMRKALEVEGFELDGTHHRGIDDARNIAKIFRKYLKLWAY